MLAITFQEWSAGAYAYARIQMFNASVGRSNPARHAPRAMRAQRSAEDAAARARLHFDQATDGRT